MSPQDVHQGVHVRVAKRHRIQERRGLIGTVVGSYGGEAYMAVDVRFADGHRRLFWPEDLDEISSPSSLQRSWWHSLLGWKQ